MIKISSPIKLTFVISNGFLNPSQNFISTKTHEPFPTGVSIPCLKMRCDTKTLPETDTGRYILWRPEGTGKYIPHLWYKGEYQKGMSLIFPYTTRPHPSTSNLHMLGNCTKTIQRSDLNTNLNLMMQSYASGRCWGCGEIKAHTTKDYFSIFCKIY